MTSPAGRSPSRPLRWRGTRGLSLTILIPLLCCAAAAADTPRDPPAGSTETAATEKKADDSPSATAAADLPERYRQWYEDVDLLLTDAEREVFLGIRENYQRDHFIRRFWKARDPFLNTTRNEFQESWLERVAQARQNFKSLADERAEIMLKIGVPTRRRPLFCLDVLKPVEIWEYEEGSDRIRGYFTLVFIGFQGRRGPHELWQPGEGLRRLIDSSRLFGANDSQLARTIAQECAQGDLILSALAQSLSFSQAVEKDLLLPSPSDEWVRTFAARSTDLPDGTALLRGTLDVNFPGRHQSRTVVQGLVSIPKADLTLAELGTHRSYNLIIDGEILRKGELFDHFRYRFTFPSDIPSEEIPLVVQRYLRPGSYQLILRAEDPESKRMFREERQIDVPRVDKKAAVRVASAPAPAGAPGSGLSRSGADPAGSATRSLFSAAQPISSTAQPMSPGAPSPQIRRPVDPEHRSGQLELFAEQLDEANASISTGDHTLRILALPDVLSVGRLRVEARARGEGIAKVAFSLNGRPVMRKTRPPFSVEIDLGDQPRIHTLRAVALGAGGEELATDEVLVNAGPHRFSVRLVEPQRGKRYTRSIRAHAEVEIPEGEDLDRVEFYLNETLLATLYQPPFEQPLLLTESQDMMYVRAVAYLDGGNSTEDVRFINAPDYVDELDVQFVELFTTITDRGGDFIDDVSAEELTVLEDGIEQRIRRFESMRDLPIRAGLVLDTSLSMLSNLRQVKTAAYRFFETVLTPRDRAALFTFNDQPQLEVRFTSDKEVLAGGLAELTAEGETALYDSIITALHYFAGLSGKRAIIILSDGEDSTSTYSYDEAIDFARRTGVAIYVIGLGLPSRDSDIRLRMRRLASETGGELFLIDSAGQLTRVYESIQEELRSQYLIAYQSSQQTGDDAFREVEVKVARRGLEAKTIKGYFP